MPRIPRYYFKIKYNFCIYNKNDIKIFKQLGVVNVLYAFIVYVEQIFIKLYQNPLGYTARLKIKNHGIIITHNSMIFLIIFFSKSKTYASHSLSNNMNTQDTVKALF